MTTYISQKALTAACLSLTLLLSSMAQAQTTPSTDELRALRFYIEQNETAAIAAELRRLRIDYPAWTPPEDLGTLLQTSPRVEIDQIYALLANRDPAAARRKLEETQAEYPDWTPPSDMIALIELDEAQVAFDRAISNRRPDAALSIALNEPGLLRCNRVNNTWQLAELQADSGNAAGAFTAYSQIISTCTSQADLIATLEKANSVATPEQLSALVQTAKNRLPSSAARFDEVEARLLAGRGLAPDGTTAVSPTETETATEAPATAANTPAPAATTPRPQPAPAPAPRAAAPSAPIATIAGAVGPGNPLAGLRRGGDNRLNQVRAAATSNNFRQCAALSARPRSFEVAYERAWCVYNLDRTLESMALFGAVANSGLSAQVIRDARYGLALSYLDREMTDAASALAASTDFLLDQRKTIEAIILDQRGVRAFETGDFTRAITYFDALEVLEGTLRRDLAILRAYAYFSSGNAAAARAEFTRLNNQLSTSETRAGLAAIRG